MGCWLSVPPSQVVLSHVESNTLCCSSFPFFPITLQQLLSISRSSRGKPGLQHWCRLGQLKAENLQKFKANSLNMYIFLHFCAKRQTVFFYPNFRTFFLSKTGTALCGHYEYWDCIRQKLKVPEYVAGGVNTDGTLLSTELSWTASTKTTQCHRHLGGLGSWGANSVSTAVICWMHPVSG